MRLITANFGHCACDIFATPARTPRVFSRRFSQMNADFIGVYLRNLRQIIERIGGLICAL